MKEPEYYGKAAYVEEGTFNPKYLDSLTSAELESFANKSEGVIRTLALLVMSKKYVEYVLRWVESCAGPVDVEECGDYLDQCNTLLRMGLNNEYKEIMVHVWPKIRKTADKIAVNSGDCDELDDYSCYRKAADVFVESRGLDIELEEAMAELADAAFTERNGRRHEAYAERNEAGNEKVPEDAS